MPRDKNIDLEFTKLFKTRRNKRGALSDLFVWLIVGFFSLIFFAVWIYAQGLIVTQLQSIPDTASLNISQATASTFGTVNSALSWLHTISFIIFFGLGLSIIITNIFVKSHPFLFIVYVLFLVATIIFSAYLSNMYDSLLLDSTIGATLQDFTATNFFVGHLPIFVTVMGFIGAITLFINIQRDVELGGGL